MMKAYDVSEADLRYQFDRAAKETRVSMLENYKDDFLELVPDKGLTRLYVDYTMGVESPTAFNFFSFLTVFGSLLRRDVWVDQQAYEVYPNMAVILVGPSGKVRKTTAANMAIDSAQEAEGAVESVDAEEFLQTGQRFYILAEKATSEAIHSALAQRSDATGSATGMIYAPELSTFLNRKEYNKTLINDLTRLWDCPKRLTVRTQARKLEELKNVAVSFLGCTNETWLTKSLPEDAFGGGFMARCLQVYQSSTNRRFPVPKTLDADLRARILEETVDTRRFQGEVERDKQAMTYFIERYNELHETFPDDERISPFYERYADHLLRIAMLLSIAERPGNTPMISGEHMEQADRILKWVLKLLPKVYAFLGVSEMGEDARRILFTILKNGGRISRQQLVRSLVGRISAQQLSVRIDTLKQGAIIAEESGGLFDDEAQGIYYKVIKRMEDI